MRNMTARPMFVLVTMFCMVFFAWNLGWSDDEEPVFAVVTKVQKDRRQATARIYIGGTVVETTLIPTDATLDNPIWRKLEICHSLRMQGAKTSEGYRITALRNLDAGMLPMALQGIAGDCLTKKALEFAPAID